MSQISKCPTLRVVLGYWEALGEVSEMRYNNLLYSSSKRSYCINLGENDFKFKSFKQSNVKCLQEVDKFIELSRPSLQ